MLVYLTVKIWCDAGRCSCQDRKRESQDAIDEKILYSPTVPIGRPGEGRSEAFQQIPRQFESPPAGWGRVWPLSLWGDWRAPKRVSVTLYGESQNHSPHPLGSSDLGRRQDCDPLKMCKCSNYQEVWIHRGNGGEKEGGGEWTAGVPDASKAVSRPALFRLRGTRFVDKRDLDNKPFVEPVIMIRYIVGIRQPVWK